MVNMILGRSGSDYHTGSMYTGKYSLTQGRKDKYLSHFFKMKLCTGGGGWILINIFLIKMYT